MRILLADDQPQVCSALRLLFENEPTLQLVGEAVSTQALLQQAHRLQPDLLLLDWELPGSPVAELLPTLRQRYPHLSILALSGRPEAYQAALAAGVDGFISKGYPAEHLLATLHNIEQAQSGPIKQALVAEWMTREVVTSSPDMVLTEVYYLMAEKSVRRLPVLEQGCLIGIVTQSDIQDIKSSRPSPLNLWTLNGSLARLTARQIMTPDPITVLPEATVGEAAQLLQTHKIGSLPVVDKHEELVGIITESDIFRMVVERWHPKTPTLVNKVLGE
jgi:acetoin utilization protein AcuB